MEKQKQIFTSPFEVRVTGDKTSGTIEGYASVFGNVDSYNTIIERGAFEDTLKERTPVFLLHHDMRTPAGIVTEAREDDRGLFFRGEMNLEVQAVRESYALAKQGALRGMSFGFRIRESFDDEDMGVTRISKVDLYEISLVTFPANPLAQVGAVRMSKEELPQSSRTFEHFLRDVGYTRDQAKELACRAFPGALKRDADNAKESAKSTQRDVDGGDSKELLSLLQSVNQQLREQNNHGQ